MAETSANTVPSLVLLGTRGVLPATILQQLLQKDWRPAAILLPAARGTALRSLPPPPPPPSELPVVASYVEQSIQELGWQQGIPVWETGQIDDGVLGELRRLAPDLIMITCWPGRLPEPLLAIPRWGCVNVHPSRLPAFRGPAPVFWQLRAGLTESAVTVHEVAPELDSGSILAQAPFRLPDGATGAELDRIAGQLGGTLLAETITALANGQSVARPQPAGGSYQSWPKEEDFTVPTDWAARRAWNFIRGTAEWGIPFKILTAGEPLVAREPLSCEPEEQLDTPVVQEDRALAVQFNPGVLRLPV